MNVANFDLNDFFVNLGPENGSEFAKDYEKDINEKLSIDENYERKFNKEVSWKQGKRGFQVEIAAGRECTSQK